MNQSDINILVQKGAIRIDIYPHRHASLRPFSYKGSVEDPRAPGLTAALLRRVRGRKGVGAQSILASCVLRLAAKNLSAAAEYRPGLIRPLLRPYETDSSLADSLRS